MAKTRYFGIKFPFARKSKEGSYVDLTSTEYQRFKSNLTHLIFTPVGSRYRNPEFGTNLMNFIFEPNDNITASDILRDLQIAISKFMSDVKLLSIETEKIDRGLKIKIPFIIEKDGYEIKDEIDITI